MTLDQWVASTEALLELDAKGALAPHGIGGFARSLLEDALKRETSRSTGDTEMTETVSTERLAVKGEGFDRQSGGFAFIHIGDQRYTKDEVIAALRAATPPAPESKEMGAIPRLSNCGKYLAQDNTGNWHYLNHAGTWQGFQGPQVEPSPIHKGEADYADYDAGLLNDFGGGDVGWWQDYLRAEIDKANDFWREQVASPVPLPVTDETERNILAWVREDVLPAYGITHNARASDPEMVEGLRAALSKPGEQG